MTVSLIDFVVSSSPYFSARGETGPTYRQVDATGVDGQSILLSGSVEIGWECAFNP